MDGSPSAIVSLGYGPWGSAGLVVTLGYGIGAVVVETPGAQECLTGADRSLVGLAGADGSRVGLSGADGSVVSLDSNLIC